MQPTVPPFFTATVLTHTPALQFRKIVPRCRDMCRDCREALCLRSFRFTKRARLKLDKMREIDASNPGLVDDASGQLEIAESKIVQGVVAATRGARLLTLA